MRISELSSRSGVPIATLKYYLREGLLPPGTRTARNQAEYGQEHLHRLRLVRALMDVGGLAVADVKAVVAAIEDRSVPTHEMLGVAHRALGPRPREGSGEDEDLVAARDEVDRYLDDLGWRVSPDAPARDSLARTLVTLRRLGREVDTSVFAPYAEAADRLARHELAVLPMSGSREEGVERMVVGTVLYESALVALRRLAQAHYSSQRFRTG